MRIVFLTLYMLAVPATGRPLHVILDAGHGGTDHGAVHSSVNEAVVTLQVTKLLRSLLVNDERFKVSMTRERDDHLTLKQRSDKANHLNGQLFLSVHVNSSPDPRAKGVEFYFQNQLPPDEESMYLAARENEHAETAEIENNKSELGTILDDLKKNHRVWSSSRLAITLAQKWDGTKKKSSSHTIRQAPFHVISNVNMPSTLVEIGFLSNPNELKKLVSAETQQQMAQSLYQGLIEYKEIIDK